jgi:glycosyltransferase involved in cell wall biosynthesis
VDEARRALQIPQGARVFLHYGIGDRRKGLHLAARAVLASPVEDNWFLLCAGELSKDREIIHILSRLESCGRSKILNRFISEEEERLCLCASDFVLLPYIGHFGSSGILSLATAAKKMVIASDEGLVGRRVSDHGLGLVFASNSTGSLSAKMKEAVNLPQDDQERIRRAAAAYSRGCSRKVFRESLLQPFRKTQRPETDLRVR